MASVTIEPGRLTGTVDAPPSKSLQHRAVLLAALGAGKSRLKPMARGDDVDATLAAVQAFGASVKRQGRVAEIIGGIRAKTPPVVDCAESGSTLRFLVPVALASGVGARFLGRGRLGERPMEPYQKICRAQGLTYERHDTRTLDLTVAGQLRPGLFELPGNVSSQFVSGLLMALPLLDGESTVRVTGEIESRGYIDLTIAAMRAFGVEVKGSGQDFTVPESARYHGCDYTIEGDYSQAAVFLCAGALGHDVRVKGLSPVSMQADYAVLTHLMRMGAGMSESGGLIGVTAQSLTGGIIDGSQSPDIVPMLALAAALAQGESLIVNAARLRLKESDRIESTCRALAALGADITPMEDGMAIRGVRRLRGGVTVDCEGDHRIAMMLAIAALSAERPVTLEGTECLNKSYPEFLQDLRALGGNVHG